MVRAAGDDLPHLGVIKSGDLHAFRAVLEVRGHFVELFQERARIVSLAARGTNSHGDVMEDAQLRPAAHVDGHAPRANSPSAVFTGIELHGLLCENGNHSKSPGLRQAAHQPKSPPVLGSTDDHQLSCSAAMLLHGDDSTRIDRRFHVCNSEAVLLHLLLGVPRQLKMPEGDLLSKRSDPRSHGCCLSRIAAAVHAGSPYDLAATNRTHRESPMPFHAAPAATAGGRLVGEESCMAG